DREPAGTAVEAVALVAEATAVQAEPDAAAAVRGDRQGIAGRGPQDAGEVLADLTDRGRVVDADVRAAGDPVRGSRGLHRSGRRYHPAERLGDRAGGGGGRSGSEGEAGRRPGRERNQGGGRS